MEHFHEALENVWKLIRRTNKYIDQTMPCLAKDEAKKNESDTESTATMPIYKE